jgi:PII-like signaling protein
MNIEHGKLLRIFIGEADHFDHKPLYQAIVERARELDCAGATVVRGIEGFGSHSKIHTARILRLSEDLPIIIEIVDSQEKLNQLLPELDKMIADGIVTIEDVQIRTYRSEPQSD